MHTHDLAFLDQEHIFSSLHTGVIFGLVTTPIVEPESVGNVSVCLQVLDPSPNITLNLDVHVVLETVPATAGETKH